MGYFIGKGNQDWYVHEDGTVWDSPKMQRKFDPITLIEIVEEIGEKLEEGLDKEIEQRYLCPYCGVSYPNKRGLNMHIQSKHRRRDAVNNVGKLKD